MPDIFVHVDQAYDSAAYRLTVDPVAALLLRPIGAHAAPVILLSVCCGAFNWATEEGLRCRKCSRVDARFVEENAVATLAGVDELLLRLWADEGDGVLEPHIMASRLGDWIRAFYDEWSTDDPLRGNIELMAQLQC